MTMAFKYQVLLCLRPKDILLVSFNHMDAIKDFVKDTPSILSQVDETYRQLIEVSVQLHCCHTEMGSSITAAYMAYWCFLHCVGVSELGKFFTRSYNIKQAPKTIKL